MKINTITKKIVLRILMLSVAVLLGFGLFFPTIFYHIMKPHLCKQISSIVGASALRQSYIWRNNTQLNAMVNSDELKQLIVDYYDGKAETVEQILEYVGVIYNGKNNEELAGTEGNGYIVFNNYMLLFTDRGDLFYPEDAKGAAEIFQHSDWYKTFDQSQEIRAHIPMIGDEETGRIFSVVESFWAGDIHCFVVNMVTAEHVLSQFAEFEEFGIRDFLVYCNGDVLYSNLGEESAIRLEECPEYLFTGKQYETLTWEKEKNMLFSVLCTYREEDYRLVVSVPEALLLAPYREAFHYVQLLLCGVTLLLLVSFGISLQGTLHRLKRLEKNMDLVRNGDYQVAVQDESSDEIGRLTNTFGMMLEKIREDREKEAQMQYMMMVSAVDPHYIYNTLNTVTALAELGRNEEVVAVNDALIGTLKDRLKMKNYKTFDTVLAEQKTLEQYMLIQSYLCYVKIDYSFRVSEEDQSLVIPKNIIQPMVENAIKHGILCREEEDDEVKHGRIDVSVVRQDGHIRIEISDNGAGMEEKTIQRFFSGDREAAGEDGDMCHIGVSNVRLRLNYLYHGDYRMEVKSSPGEGTSVCLLLPMKTGAE